MRKAYFNIASMALYPSSLVIPDSVKEGEELSYIRNNLAKCKREGELTWIEDLEPNIAVEEEDIKDIEEIEQEDAA